MAKKKMHPGLWDGEKPPFRIPSTESIKRRKLNGLTAISTFSGCGGSCLGLRAAGWRVAAAAEFLEEAADSYRANFPRTPIETRDLRAVTGADLLEMAGVDGELDLLEGSPPCDPFSMAGHRHKKWGEEKTYMGGRKIQQTDDLFLEYARLVGEIRPRVFCAENVPGLAIGKAKGYLKEIHAALRDHGYRVQVKLLDAQWLGVPQARRRLFIQGVRDDLDRDPAWPTPMPYRYSIRDALPWIDSVFHDTGGDYGQGEVADRPSPTVTVGAKSWNSKHFQISEVVSGRGSPSYYRGKRRQGTDEPIAVIPAASEAYEISSRKCRCRTCVEAKPVVIHGEEPQITVRDGHGFFTVERGVDDPAWTITAMGAEEALHHSGLPPGWEDLPDEERGAPLYPAVGREWDKLRPGEGSDRYFNLIKQDPDEPATTLLTESRGASIAHPYERRKFSIPELRRLCGFPDDFKLTGTYAQRWARLGMAVPPPMTEAIGRAVAELLRDVDGR